MFISGGELLWHGLNKINIYGREKMSAINFVKYPLFVSVRQGQAEKNTDVAEKCVRTNVCEHVQAILSFLSPAGPMG